MNKTALLVEDYFLRVDHIERQYHRRQHHEALQRLSALLVTLRAQTQLPANDHQRLLLQLTSLRGLVYFTTLQYDAAEADFNSCKKLDPYHSPTCFRRIALFLKKKKLPQALDEMRMAYRVFPESKYRGYEIALLEELLEDVKGERRFQLKKGIDELLCQDQPEQDQMMLNFANLRRIERATKRGLGKRPKIVDFGETQQIQIRKESVEELRTTAPVLDFQLLREQNEMLKEYIMDLENVTPEQIVQLSTPDKKYCRSILKPRALASMPPAVPNCSLFAFRVQKVRNIDGKAIRTARALRMGQSTIVGDSNNKNQYMPGLKPSKSLIKINGSFCLQKYRSQLREKGLQKYEVDYGFQKKIRDIEGKLSIGVLAASSNIEQDLTVVVTQIASSQDRPKHDYTSGQGGPSFSLLKKSCMKDPSKSILRKLNCGKSKQRVRRFLVCFKE